MSSQTICKQCRKAPVHGTYEFCGRTCGAAWKKGAGGGSSNNNAYGGYQPNAGWGGSYNGSQQWGGAGAGAGGGGAYQAGYGGYGTGYGSGYSGWSGGFPQGGYDPTMCAYCGQFPKKGRFEYCSRTCGHNAKQYPAQAYSAGPQQQNIPPYGGGYPVYQPPSNPCGIPGCTEAAHPGGQYCSHPHREQAVKLGLAPACLYCKTYPRPGKELFCGSQCKDTATNAAPMLLEVPETDPRFTDVSGQFTTAWKHTTTAPKVTRVYKIILPQSLLDSYEKYKTSIETKGKFVKRNLEPGNERRRWHGTTRLCTIGDDPKNITPCTKQGCSVCAILRGSYDVKYAAVGMFGRGLYTSATSSKSDTYTNRSATTGTTTKAMFLNRVVVGKGQILTSAQSSLTAAPAGFDSVIANPGSGLNYDELIVYNNDAIRTSWLLLYQK